ncbi:MAG: beta-ketoacyl synthase N-terminal-like domain-containing protein, partial [Legionellaceae bacterium]|nr:beta-ketoacyl synthase N-terminal-like domain-containing protein [Legionellaceae bacterium]
MLDVLNRYAHGYVLLPILDVFYRRHVFEYINTYSEKTITQLSQDLQANEGHFRVALRLLQSLGWLSIEQDCVSIIDQSFQEKTGPLSLILPLYQTTVFESLLSVESFTQLEQWVAFSKKNQDHDSAQWCDMVDGPLAVTLLLALHKKMPVGGVSELFQSLDQNIAEVVRAFFVHKKWLIHDELTALGQYLIERCLILAVAASYRPMLRQIETVLFGDPSIVFNRDEYGHENHVDRILNIEASSFQHEKFFLHVDELIEVIFNQPQLDRQPKYIVDMGCGDGSLLKRIYELIQHKTHRGKCLDRFPLLMIGVDFNEQSLMTTRLNLTEIPHLVLQGNIEAPQQLIADLKNHIDHLESCLHLRSFLDHEISYQAVIHSASVGQKATGVYVASNGDNIEPCHMLQRYLAHFSAWASVTTRHGLIVLEVHSASPSILAQYIDESGSLHFDALQAFSGQNLLAADEFLAITAQAGLFAEKNHFKRFPNTLPFTRITLNWFKKQDYYIRSATINDLPQLMVLEQACWQPELQVKQSLIVQRIERFSCYVIVYSGRIVGAAYSQRIAERDVLWTARHKDIDLLHHPHHPILQLIGINVFPNEQHLALGDVLLSFILQQALVTEGIESVVGVTRCNHYLAHAATMSYDEYVLQTRGIDSVLLFHLSHGAKIRGVIPEYRPEDLENLGHGVLIEYALSDNWHNESTNGLQEGCTFTLDNIQNIVAEKIQHQLNAYQKKSTYTPTRAFRDLGLDSLDLVELKTVLNQTLRLSLETSVFFRYSNPTELIQYIQRLLHPDLLNEDLKKIAIKPSFKDASFMKESLQPNDIAIIGMSCEFPGNTHSPDDFWRLLSSGESGIRPLPQERVSIWNDAGFDAGNPIFLYGGFIDNVDRFDAAFFGISPREAVQIDPQHRLLLELHWHALEHAGINPKTLAGSNTGIYVGIFSHDYELLKQTYCNDVTDKVYLATGSSESVAAGRISYFLDLTGPAMAVNTACSSSLVAVHLACQSLRQMETNLALASGVNLMLSPQQTEIFASANMLSTTGECRVFDKGATGYVRGEGAGVVVLKRLDDAKRDNDKIWAVIRSTGVNQDGATNGLTAPNQTSQEQLLQRVLDQANCDASAVSFIEAHGTGTILGDPVELSAIQSVYGQNRSNNNPLYIGSVKSNLGHLEAAAGMAGLIKTILMLEHKEIVKNLHFKSLNPNISLDKDQIKISTKHKKWFVEFEKKRLASVSSFGFSGTNAHVLLEEAPSNQISKHISLYPFKRERYWFDRKPKVLSLGLSLSSGFLHSKLNSPGKDKIFNVELSLSKDFYLVDHVVFNQVIFPGTGYLEICFEVMANLEPRGSYRIDDITFERALSLSEDVSTSLQVIVSEQRELVIYSTKDSVTWQRHCRAILGLVDTFPHKQLNIPAYVKRAETIWSGEACYERMNAQGVYYGPSFQGVRAIHHVNDGVLAEIILGDKQEHYIAHPAVLDSCLQSIMGLVLVELSLQFKTHMPISIKSVRLNGALPHHVWVKVDKRSFFIQGNRLLVTLEIYNTMGLLIGLIDEFALTEVTTKQLAQLGGDDDKTQELYYELAWVSHRSVNVYEPRRRLDAITLAPLDFATFYSKMDLSGFN